MKTLPLIPGTDHFGERIRAHRLGHKMTRGFYGYPNRKPHQRYRREQMSEEMWEGSDWMYRDEEHAEHSDAYLLVQRDRALRNFDLSMAHFETLDPTEFEAALQKVLATDRRFTPVESLRDWDGVSGAYVMVFDDYRQFYIGKSDDIRKRIRTHWTGRKSFDRLLFGSPYSSIFPVDELRALDTTRIYAVRSSSPFSLEERAEKAADAPFCLNRIGGGEGGPLTMMLALPRLKGRTHGVTAAPMTRDEYSAAWDEVSDMISSYIDRASLVARLANMDMQIYAITRDDDTTAFWSRQDAIAGAAANGDLTVPEFTQFLEAMGEKIVWLED
ncbi:hypothetical protein ART_3408 [Arthrobacter sp. PAMC 25486]|uniref:GIY-YIG nuclease family protein n=1 Tax=Arthrobacter sp. PAMC 25486 TaxID=1494608 RepID=UPI0005359EFB|nr:GIY-YIG nuclease family protein [Arthrobacter sp. PAMC 25486]AIY03007.1 hypothetical protein ART_3408 [Arthrobacter sp. PAMC 25486]